MEIRETCYEQMGDRNRAVVSTNEAAWIRKILKLADTYGEEVRITQQPEDNGGYLVAEVPKKWFVLRPPKKMNYTEEQKAAMQERMANMRKMQRGE